MRRRARVDGNHKAITEALRAAGWHVEDTSRTGLGFPDLVCAKHGRVVLVEVKDGSKSFSRRKLTKDEFRCARDFNEKGVQIYVIESVDEAVRL